MRITARVRGFDNPFICKKKALQVKAASHPGCADLHEHRSLAQSLEQAEHNQQHDGANRGDAEVVPVHHVSVCEVDVEKGLSEHATHHGTHDTDEDGDNASTGIFAWQKDFGQRACEQAQHYPRKDVCDHDGWEAKKGVYILKVLMFI